jgi:gamma-glutamyltranspeptidase/glutathione hydrolase
MVMLRGYDTVPARVLCAALVLCVAVMLPAAVRARAAAPVRAAVASAHPLATEAGLEILANGGNAFDAAVAVAAALAVVEPYSSGLGGGGFLLLHRASDGFEIVVDAREAAPAAAHRDLYLDARGEVIASRSRDGALAAAIPGLPAALDHVARRYGRLAPGVALAPAIRLARQGFEVTERYRLLAGYRKDALRASPAAAEVFLGAGGETPPLGHVIRQSDLAAVLERLADGGPDTFYRGEFARRLVAGVRAAGGIWTERDLEAYRIVERPPLVGRYRGLRVVSAPPPSSGGVVLLQALNMLDAFDLAALDGTARLHVTIEALRRAYRDRAEYLGDTDFVEVPVERLVSKAHAREQFASFDATRATSSAALPAIGTAAPGAGQDTTHYSIIDHDGNVVAATLSINLPFGAALVVPGTGVLLNDEMDDFSARPLTPNAYGLIGDHANAIAPGKRPLSSMTPTILESSTRTAALGTPGGSRIISMVLLATLDFADGRPATALVGRARVHHQYVPDEVSYESDALTPDQQAALRALGHVVKESGREYGNMQAVVWDRASGAVEAASDPRGEGRAGYFLRQR